MHRPLPVSEAAMPPGGIVIRPFRPGYDETAWLVAHAAAFSGHPEAGMWTADWLDARMRRGWFDPPGFLLAWDGDEIAAYCWTKVHSGGVGEIFLIGVHPDARGRGLGRVMSLAGLHDLGARRKCSSAMLYVDGDNHGGTRLYTSIGFSVERTDVVYEAAGRAPALDSGDAEH
jgi:mycothiol synthase